MTPSGGTDALPRHRPGAHGLATARHSLGPHYTTRLPSSARPSTPTGKVWRPALRRNEKKITGPLRRVHRSPSLGSRNALWSGLRPKKDDLAQASGGAMVTDHLGKFASRTEDVVPTAASRRCSPTHAAAVHLRSLELHHANNSRHRSCSPAETPAPLLTALLSNSPFQ